jgi:ABC-type lipoprotein export system ATPase subunit
LLSLEHVDKTHHVGPYEKAVMVDVSVSIAPGEFVGVWGGRRAGKSTLLRLASGLDVADRGVVRFEGRDLARMSRAQLGSLRLRDVGVSFGEGPQSPELTVADYVALPLLTAGSSATARARANEALRRTGVLECRHAPWSRLSDTEQVLASLAHALARRPRLLLVDDPTPRLDARHDYEIVGLLRSLADSGAAVLMTTSSMAALSDVDRAFTLGDGRLDAVSVPEASVVAFPQSGPRP